MNKLNNMLNKLEKNAYKVDIYLMLMVGDTGLEPVTSAV